MKTEKEIREIIEQLTKTIEEFKQDEKEMGFDYKDEIKYLKIVRSVLREVLK